MTSFYWEKQKRGARNRISRAVFIPGEVFMLYQLKSNLTFIVSKMAFVIF
jgi:hypothetical protein